jgi:type IV/VI secretion system ImpK/VasF family protein
MSGQDGTPPNRTVIFRASPLQEMKDKPPPQAASSIGTAATLAAETDDIPSPPSGRPRNRLLFAAESLLSLLASVRAARAKIELPRLHKLVGEAIEAYRVAVTPHYSEETVRSAVYALCATADDVAQNLPGQQSDAAEWARRSMVVRYFGETVSGDRFWMLLDTMTAQPPQYRELLELCHACMACGFEGRYRVSGGAAKHFEQMQRTYKLLEHPRQLSATELSPRWRGLATDMASASFWTPLLVGAGVAALVLTLIYIGLRVSLYQSSVPTVAALQAIDTQPPLKLGRAAPQLAPVATGQVVRIRQFLAPEIAAKLVDVIEDASTIRVRATAPLLFDSGRADLRKEHYDLFGRIAAALDTEPGPVQVQGYTDSEHMASVLFPDNLTLSQARADNVAKMIRGTIKDPSRVTSQGFGETHPLVANDTPEGRARNRRVEVVIQRSDH